MKRRIRRIRRALKRAGLYNAFHITLIAVLLTGFCVILFNAKELEQQEEKPETTQAEVMQNPETMTQTAESIEDKYKVFDTMSEDWGSDDLEGFVFYDLPEKYADKRQSNSSRWVSRRVFLICASHIRKAHTADCSLK